MSAIVENVKFSADEVLTALREKLPDVACALCRGTEFSLSEGFVHLVCSQDSHMREVSRQTDRALTCAAIVCRSCGDTRLINLLTIGTIQASE